MHFNPVNTASGEYDRMGIFNAACNEDLFSIQMITKGIYDRKE